MKCKHDIKDLIGTSGGIKCRACGKVFASFKELEKDIAEDIKAEKAEPKAEETPAEIIEEAQPEKKSRGRGRKAAK